MEDMKIKKEKKVWTVGGILKTVIIAILALLMVGGSFYYIFTPGFREDSNAFGFYDGEPVLYENNNVFGRSLAGDTSYMTAITTGDYNSMWTSWYQAYQSQVVYIALSKMAEEAGIIAPESLVAQLAVDSGAFNNENGEFDQTIYDSLSDADKRLFFTYLTDSYPYQKVLDDVYTALSSAKEKEFITKNSSNGKNFDYFVVGSNAFPYADTIAYVNDHADEFLFVDASMISCLSEEDAENCYNELSNGLAWEEAVAKYSNDSYAVDGGNIGGAMFAGVFKANLKDVSDVSKITVLKAGEYTKPIDGLYAWTIYKANADPYEADFEDEEVLLRAKSMIYEDNPELVQPFIEDSLEFAVNYAKNDFDYAAEAFGTGKAIVGPAVNNIGNSSIVYGLQTADSYGVLAQAAMNDEELNKELFSEEVGYVAGPIDLGGSYMFVKVSGESDEIDMGTLTSAMYDYYKNQFGVVDLQNAVILSDKHEDNFTSKFFELILGSSL